MSLHYLVKLKILISHVLPLNLSPKETQVFIPLQLLPPNSPDLNPVDNNMWGILQDIMYKTRITDLELSTTPLTNGCCNDYMIPLAHLILSRCFSSSRSLMRILYTLLQYSLHAVIKWIQILVNLGATVEVG